MYPNKTQSFTDTRHQTKQHKEQQDNQHRPHQNNQSEKQHENNPKHKINQNQQPNSLHPNQTHSFTDTRHQSKQQKEQQDNQPRPYQNNQPEKQHEILPKHNINQNQQPNSLHPNQTHSFTDTRQAKPWDKKPIQQSSASNILSASASSESNVSINSNKDNLSVQSSTTSAIFSETDDKYQQIQISNLSADKLGFPLKPKERCTIGRDIRLFANHYGFILNKPFEILHYDINIYKVYKDKTGIEISKEVKTKDQSK